MVNIIKLISWQEEEAVFTRKPKHDGYSPVHTTEPSHHEENTQSYSNVVTNHSNEPNESADNYNSSNSTNAITTHPDVVGVLFWL